MTICMDCPDAFLRPLFSAVSHSETVESLVRGGWYMPGRPRTITGKSRRLVRPRTPGYTPHSRYVAPRGVRKPKRLKKRTYQLRVDDLPVFGLVEVAGLEEVVDALLRSRHPHRAHRPPNNERALDRLVVVLRDELVHDLLDTPLR